MASLAALFPEGGQVDVEDLVAAGAVRSGQPVKILGNGDISVAVQVSAHAFSSSPRSKIAAAGGSATEPSPDGQRERPARGAPHVGTRTARSARSGRRPPRRRAFSREPPAQHG